jgi:anti-sigma regulatory factor (Ser/Thr protein kinase)
MQARTQFPPQPRSAAEARHWVRDHLTEMGRSDLVDSAEAGVSELVTNCILHAQTSIGLHMTGSNSRVIIEVYDAAPMVHKPAGDPADPDTVDSTIGRGLRIVRAHAQEWGVSTSTQGKAIWFQPTPTSESAGNAVSAGSGGSATDLDAARSAATEQGRHEPHLAIDLDGALEALAEAFPEPAGPPDQAELADRDSSERDEPLEVRLLGAPPWVVQHYRNRWLELIREMQLVALGEPSTQQAMAGQFCRAAQLVEPDLYLVEGTAGGGSFAVSDNGEVVDIVLRVRPSMRSAFVEVRELAREMEKKWAGIQLLFVHPGAQAVQLREWWLGELIGQIDGAEPTPWPGDWDLHDEAMASAGDA